MQRVAASEYDLLRVTQALVGAVGPREAEALLSSGRPMPEQIGPTAAALLRDTLAKGAVKALVRRGGWRHEYTLKEGEPVTGRLWERHPPTPLRFGPASFKLLRWLTGEAVEKPSRRLSPLKNVTVGDELLAYLACDLLQRTDLPIRAAYLRRSPLAWLAFPNVLCQPLRKISGGRTSGSRASGSRASAKGMAHLPSLNFNVLLNESDGGPLVLEALQEDLTLCWVRMERYKSRVSDLAGMQRLGDAQAHVLDVFLDRIDAIGRRDLAGFLVEAAERLLRPGPSARFWIRRLSRDASFAERQAAFEAAGAFLRAVIRVGGWYRELALVRFFDDEYDAAQRILSAWESFGDAGFSRVEQIHAELDVTRLGLPREDGAPEDGAQRTS